MYNNNSNSNINEIDHITIVDSEETQHETGYRTEMDESQEEYTEDTDEIEEEDSDEESVNDLMSKSSTQARCAMLLDQVKVLKLDNNLLRSREQSYIQRIEMYEKDNTELQDRIMEMRKKVSSLENEVDIVKSNAQARYSTLEKTYRDLCSSLSAAEEVNQNMRYTINDLHTRNKVLEELVETKTQAVADLETRVMHLHKLPELTDNDKSLKSRNLVKLKRKLFATERQMSVVVSDLSKIVTYNFTSNEYADGDTFKYFDYQAMLDDYNQKCVRLKELEVMVDKNEYVPKIRLMRDKIKMLKQKLEQRSKLMLEKDKEMVDFYNKQTEELKNAIKENERESTLRKQEFVKLELDNSSLKVQLELQTRSLKHTEEELQKAKPQIDDLIIENDGLKKKVNNYMENERALKAELQASLDRENTQMTRVKNYMGETDLKMKNMELELAHYKQVANEARRQEEIAQARQKELEKSREDEQKHQKEQKEENGKMDEAFKQEILEELANVKQLVTSLEKSKKEQQQINNLILTLRHQNDTVLKTLKEENKNTLTSFSEKNLASLSELKEENSKIVASLTDKMASIVEIINKREEEITEKINQQFETLKSELKPARPEHVDGHQESDPVEQQVEVDQDQGLEEKYKKLKECFKNTTASLLRKEKILLDSLKKTVIECHTYKEKLDSLCGSADEPKDCNCSSMVKRRDSKSKPLTYCWCSSKSYIGLRQEIAKRALACENAALDSMKNSLNQTTNNETTTSLD